MCKEGNKLFTFSFCLMHIFKAVLSSCNIHAYGLYCSNTTERSLVLFMKDNTTSNTLINEKVRAIFFTNMSGKLSDDSFSLFPKAKSVDVQGSRINGFQTNKTAIHNLYLMNNPKFPPLSATFFQRCCQKLTVLLILDNSELIIENEAFKDLNELKHLTISKQNIKHLNKRFLKGLNGLTYLNLSEDGIETVDENTFEDIKNLNYLILNDNKITKFEYKTFNNLKELESLEFVGLNLIDFNMHTFNNQKELKTIGLPTKLIKHLKIDQLTLTFRKLETIVLSDKDKANHALNKFILQCEDNGFTVKYT